MEVTSYRPENNFLELQTKREESAEKIKENGFLGYKIVKKTRRLLNTAIDLTETFKEDMPNSLTEISVALRVFKIFRGALALPKIYKNILTVIRPGELKERILSGWTIVKCVKKVIGAVETVFYYLNKLNLVAKAALAWTTITGYVLMPISFISTGIDIYLLNDSVQYMKSFCGRIKEIKQEVNTESAKKPIRLSSNPATQEMQLKRRELMKSVEKTKRICKHILINTEQLSKQGVFTKNCPINDRVNSVLKQLKSKNEATQLKGIAAGKHLKSRLKDRLKERVGAEAVSTSLSVAGIASTIIGLACPPAAPALVVVGAVITVINVANFAYKKIIPSGDIMDTEKRMLFSTAGKKIKVAKKALTAKCVKLKQNVYDFTQKAISKLNIKPAAKALAAA